MSKKSRHAGKLLPIAKPQPKVEPVAAPDSISLSEQEQDEIRRLNAELDRAKAILGDQVIAAEMHKSALIEQVRQAHAALLGAVSNIMTNNGLDPADPSKGKWHFNTDTMILARTA